MNNSVFIIGEIGINHNGDMQIVRKLIQGAKWAGADAVKFQKRTISKVYSPEELDKTRESPWGTTNRQQKNGLELNEMQYDIIDEICKEEGIEWFASPWDLDSVKFLEKYNLKYNKIASALLTHKELVETIAKQGKYTFISTGMSTLQEIEEVIKVFQKYNCPFELMHCISTYPAKEEDLNLLVIPQLRATFNCKVGYSGHEVGLPPSAIAVALGATSIERHITISHTIYGSDQAASIEIDGFKRLVDMIRQTEKVLGNGIKVITPEEEKIKSKLRRNKDY